MKSINKTTILIILSFIIIFFSCNDESKDSLDKKAIIRIEANVDATVLTKSSDIEINLKIQQINSDGTPVQGSPVITYNLEESISTSIEIDPGMYKLTAIAGNDPNGKPTSDPFYVGSEQINLSSGEEKNVDIECKLTTVVVGVDYRELSIYDINGYDYETVVSTVNGDAIVFGKDDSEKFGYFSSGDLSVVFRYKNGQSNWIEKGMPSILETQEQYKYIIKYNVKEDQDGNSGSASIGIVINEDPESKEGEITIELPQLKSSIDKIVIDLETLKAEIYATYRINNGSQFNNIELQYCISGETNWTNINASQVGEGWGAQISDLLPNKTYKVRLKENPAIEKDFTTTQITQSSFAFGKFALVQTEYEQYDLSAVNFQYKKITESEWINSSNQVDYTKGAYVCALTGLDSNTSYNYRIIFNSGEIQGNIGSFTTEGISQLPYSDFDNWFTEKTGTLRRDTWYNGISGEDKFWDSGNQGANTLSAKNPTSPEESIVVSNKAAKLESMVVSGNFAAGNIYTGNYGSTSVIPVGATLKFGQPYTARPTKLKGYYRYQPKNINKTKSPYTALNGNPDSCNIYIALTDWTTQFNASTASSTFVDFDADYIIAYGSLTKDQIGKNMSTYESFEIDIEYRDNRTPTYVLVVATASKYGDYFTGGEGSILYIDEFELDFEYNEASFKQIDLSK